MSSIRFIDDKQGNHVLPVTHERAVYDDAGNTLPQKMGSLSDLNTENKSNLVAAINEAYQHGGGLETIEVIEDGLYFVDSNMKIGAYFNNTGFHSINNVEL